MVEVELLFTPDDVAKLKALEPRALEEFLKRQGHNMVAQVRRNIVMMNKPKLSEKYGQRKKEGKTPGAGKFRVALLRDTGTLYDSLDATVTVSRDEISVSLTARGEHDGGISNAELLEVHAEGKGKMPARHPALPDQMHQFQARFANELDQFLDGK